MGTRHNGRELALKALYQIDLRGGASTDDLAFVHGAGAHWVTEHAAAAEIVELVRAVLISDN